MYHTGQTHIRTAAPGRQDSSNGDNARVEEYRQ